ncbi:hypothetical protein [Photorhabdus antumapuensis]|uniref:hypothetical protein n=1 Tax=Photorhabdus antumapuensis TaxID=2862867 RepID=UPI001CEC9D1C|nr:hypothetical protein [Photorhabdus antumapuensis]MCA6219801.1 hypothetical protein [Photorhabdus antumapuensis]
MKHQKATYQALLLLTSLWFILFFCMVFITSLILATIFYFKDGQFFFTLEDVYYSFKMGASTGIPTGIGIWIMSRLKENKDGQ